MVERPPRCHLRARSLTSTDAIGTGQRDTERAATVPINSDDTYLLDRWVLLSEGNDIVDVTQETTTVPDGSYAAAKIAV